VCQAHLYPWKTLPIKTLGPSSPKALMCKNINGPCLFNCKFKDLFERKPNQIPPLSIRVQPDLRAVGFVKRNALIYSIPATPPWLLKRPHINYNIHYSSKENTSPEIYRNKFFEFCDHYKDFSQLYTDGSKMGNEVAAAVVHRNVTKTTRLQIKPASSEQSYMLFHLHSLSFAVVKKRILLFFRTLCQTWKL